MKKEKNKITFDTFAILTYLKEEPGWQKVRDYLWDMHKGNIAGYLNYVNLGELYYIIYRENGASTADKAISMIKLWPLKFVEVREHLAIIAGRIKAENKLSYADAYVAATAINEGTAIITGDKEFKSVEDLTKIIWLP